MRGGCMCGLAGFAVPGVCLGRWGMRTGSWGGRGRRGIGVVCFPVGSGGGGC